ncbi:MAG: DNA helicase [Bacilli bacterium]|nr:DNA helicase [Bacilli bacterium]
MKNIELLISESIKTGKWLDISYKNKNGENTFYWIAIKDIDLKDRILKVKIFNEHKSLDCVKYYVNIYVDQIINARLLDFTTYDVPVELINKIETHKDAAKWLKYESFNNNILEYYMKCNELDNDPYQESSFLIEGIDRSVLLKKKKIVLNNEQCKKVIEYIKKYDFKGLESERNYLILSFLSIETNNRKYVVLYYDVVFNPDGKTLSVINIPRVNQSFLIKDKRYSISSYIDIDPNEFEKNITHNIYQYYKEYRELIRANLRVGEIINELPEFMILQRSISAILRPTFEVIQKKQEKGLLERPLKAFFGNSNRTGAKRKEPSIVIYDNKVNIDQMRVIYNAMKYPVNYVQGPPGTGKTQTILNVILSSFFNDKTVLVCSSNNRPVNGIIEKLNFTYKNNITIPFPYLRLGNRNEVIKATERIIDLYNFTANLEPNEEKINKIKNMTKEGNKDLIDRLEKYESRRELRNRIDSAVKLLESLDNKDNRLYKNTKDQLDILVNEYKEMPIISNDDVIELVTTVSDDPYFKQYMYFESINYIKRLKFPKYEELIDICTILDEEERVIKFNQWCSNDDNMKLLLNVFPIIMTTNISVARLGSPENTFDLVIMDEAGQCNCATALLPIARAKGLLLVGDTNQLKPVIVLEDIINEKLKKEFNIKDDYDYCTNSILTVMKNHDKISKDIMLTYHYRCGKKIINFSNKRFYDSQLNLDYLNEDGKLSLIDVKNMNSKLRNENYEEAKAIIDYIKRNELKDAAIITPFKNQQNLITKMIDENGIKDITCGTIHQVQGGEKDTIIISTSLSPKTSKRTFEWIKNNAEITNVAVTRAKKRLIVVSDTEALNKLSTDKKDDLYNLVNYIIHNGNTEVLPNESYTIQIGKSNGSKNEDEFFKTISHFCSINNNFKVFRNIKFSALFSNDPILKNSKLEFDVVLYRIDKYENIYPEVAIELQGGEHLGNVDRERCDNRKVRVCKEMGIKLLMIPNSFIKSYETIKELILQSCGEQIEQLELF